MAAQPSKQQTEQHHDLATAHSILFNNKDWISSEEDLAKTDLALHPPNTSNNTAGTKGQAVEMILGRNDFPVNWQDEMDHHAGSAYRTNDLDVRPSQTRLLESRGGHAGSGGADWQTETSSVPMLRLPHEYVWSGNARDTRSTLTISRTMDLPRNNR